MESNGIASKQGLDGDPDLQFLLDGGDLLKVRSSNWKKTRFYKLREDCKTLWYESHKSVRSSNPTFSVDDIAAVRLGRQTEGLQKHTEDHVESRAFSIMFKSRRKNLDLIASSEQEAKRWVAGLEKLMSNMGKLTHQQKTEQWRGSCREPLSQLIVAMSIYHLRALHQLLSWIFNCMRKADKDSNNKMCLKELKSFLHHINIEVDDDYAKELFEQCDESKCGYLDGKEIEHFYKILTTRQEIDVIFEEYAKTKDVMSAEDLLHFLNKEQREAVGLNHALALIDKYEPDTSAKERKVMTKDGFLMYLHQPEGMIFNPAHKGVYQDMTQPLNHYFISSSHNTYLMEDQLKGPSSTEAYIRALLKSCRCVELDCWDGSDGEPVIYHGYTLTSKILFKDAIKAIRDYAFKTSEYPVILSLENHCSVEQQRLMAQHMMSILGSALVTKPLGDKMPTNFPSPEELKGRFVIKGKRLNKLEEIFSTAAISTKDVVSEEEESGDDEEEDQKPKKSKKLKLAKMLSDIVIYCKSVHFHGFDDARENLGFYEMSSFKEGKAVKLAEESANQYIRHNIDKLSRIYPAGRRTDSSNYNPVPLWNSGCQIVALNFQTPCTEMDVHQGRFLPNGLSGYILKPAYLRDRATEFDPVTLTRGEWLQHKTLHIMVISAQQLPKVNPKKSSIVDPLVRVEIYGVNSDVAKKETEHIDNNGFNPMWNANFQFDVYVPELALVRFSVEDYDAASNNEFIGQYTLPFSSIQCGYHHVPLLNKNGDRLPSATLFVHTMIMDEQGP